MVLMLLLAASAGYAQNGTIAVPAPQDTTRLIEILPGSRSMRQFQKDSTTLITLAGNAAVKQGNTYIYGDSIVVNQLTGVAEVFGNVHINDADSVHTYAQYLKYIGKDRIAYLKKSVRLTDGKGQLFTDDLEYNLSTGIATYKGGGRVVNGKTVLTSSDAVYYSDTKDVYFKKYVHLTDPKYDIVADSLLYNTQLKEAHFISPTRIKTKEGTIINTKNGIYNLETGEARFFDRTGINDAKSHTSISADNLFSDDKTGIAVAEGNAKFVDSVNKVTVIAGRQEVNRKENSFLATRKPVMIFYDKGDSTYVAADTLFSGLRKYDTKTRTTTVKKDTLKSTIAVDLIHKDTAGAAQTLSVFKNDTLRTVSPVKPADSLSNLAKTDTLQKPSMDSIRYFLGFHHVRIFNDSLQAVSDSMYYSTEDSVFRLFQAPVFWNDKTQVSGDTMYLYTQNRQPKRLNVFFNALVISKENDAMYNQVGGRTLNAYFAEGNIDYIRIKGSPAESVFYPQDDDSAYVGMNRSSGDVIDVYFVNKQLNKIKFVNNVDGTLFPLRTVTNEQKYLKGFIWQDKRRPKNKLELFE
ncbi:hypothetical protein EGI32_16000 [Ferruginibacter sp. HRS2-29]|nr:hypothetical protein [Ferruginibacter sp. HRS2-29]